MQYLNFNNAKPSYMSVTFGVHTKGLLIFESKQIDPKAVQFANVLPIFLPLAYDCCDTFANCFDTERSLGVFD